MTLRQNRLEIVLEEVDPQGAGVHSLLARRVSRAGFSPEAIGRPEVIQLLQAARCAPSSHNSQPWLFLVVTDGPNRTAINQSLEETGAGWAVQAPLLLAVVADLQAGTRQNGLNYTLFDCGLAVQNILLQAGAMGLLAHPVNYYRQETMRRLLDLPQTHELLLFVAVGRPGPASAQTESNRLRKPLGVVARWDHWEGRPVSETG